MTQKKKKIKFTFQSLNHFSKWSYNFKCVHSIKTMNPKHTYIIARA